MQQRLPLLGTQILFAHRGASAYAPENTLAAFSLALKLGVNGLESDIWTTRDSKCKLVDSTRLAKIKEGPERRAATLAANGIDAFNMHYSDWNGGLAALFHRFNIVSFGWDMQHEAVIENGIRMGLDGVFSDWPDRMVEVISKQG